MKYDNPYIALAIKNAGGVTKVARAFNISLAAVKQWRCTHVPPRRVLQLEKLCNNTVTRYQLAPDFYPED